jgi:hypothetical protein
MVQGYYTLQEAAQALGMAPEDLKQMAQRNQIRSFQDRGTWRFRVQDIQELARRRGAGSDSELALPQPPSPRPHDSPAPRSPRPGQPKSPEVFDFDVGGGEMVAGLERIDQPGSGRGKSPKPTSPKSPVKAGPKSPSKGPISPKPGSDSDVRLVPDAPAGVGEDSGPRLADSDSDVKMVHEPIPAPSSSKLGQGQRKPGSSSPPPQKKSGADAVDSGVRLVPMDSDSDVRIVGDSSDEIPLGQQPPKSTADSDIRLEHQAPLPSPADSSEGMLTEEINLDEELRQKAPPPPKPQAKIKPKSKVHPHQPSAAPDVGPPAKKKDARKPDSSDYDLTPSKEESSSSDFDLTPAPGSSPLEPGSSDFELDLGDAGELKGPSSGISLTNPVDSGISLEQGGEGSDEIEFELSLDAAATPKPAPAGKPDDSDSEFELSLDVDKSGAPDSDSEFELTLDDSGGLVPVEGETPQAKAGGDKDIFETDFEVPALEDESGSQVAAIEDTDSSDFDLALGDSDIAAEDESGSQVVALDEEEADAGAATVARADQDIVVDEETADFGVDEAAAAVEAEGEEVGVREVVRERVLKPAPWGPVPTLLMVPCVVIMLLVGLLGFELVQSITGYKAPGVLTKAVSKMVGQEIK